MVLCKEKSFLLFRILSDMVERWERFHTRFLRLMEVLNELFGIIGEWSSSTSISFFLIFPSV
jgi:hypothetical protein